MIWNKKGDLGKVKKNHRKWKRQNTADGFGSG